MNQLLHGIWKSEHFSNILKFIIKINFSYNYTTTRGVWDGGLGTYGGNDLDNCESDYTYYKTTKPDQWTLNLVK